MIRRQAGPVALDHRAVGRFKVSGGELGIEQRSGEPVGGADRQLVRDQRAITGVTARSADSLDRQRSLTAPAAANRVRDRPTDNWHLYHGLLGVSLSELFEDI